MGMTKGKAEVEMTGEIKVIEVKRKTVVIEFNGITHVLSRGDTFTVTLFGDFRLSAN